MKKTKFLLLLLAVLSLVLAACVPAKPESTEVITIQVCHSAISVTQSVLPYAVENGIFEKYGLDVETTYIESGSTAATALIAGDVDFCILGGSSIINAAVAGEDLKIVGGLNNTYLYSLIVQPEITSIEDLIGGTLAISKPGGSSDNAARTALAALGLDPDNDISIIAVGGTSSRLAAMEAGEVDATVVTPPTTVKARNAGFTELVSMAEMGIAFQHTGIATSQSYLDENSDAAIRFMKAINETVYAMKNDPAGASAIIASFMELDPVEDVEIVAEGYNVMILSFMQFPTFPTAEGVQLLLDGLVADVSNAANFTAADIINTDILDQLEAEGFFDSLSQE